MKDCKLQFLSRNVVLFRTLRAYQLLVVFLHLICVQVGPSWSAEVTDLNRHMYVYGASQLLTDHAETIANTYGMLITEYWKSPEVKRIKAFNPEIKILFYRDLIGMLESYEDFKIVNKQHPEWFVRDEQSGKRIRHEIHGWYLMDITNTGFQEFLISFIKTRIIQYPDFDGVFLDDVTETIRLSHFTVKGFAESEIPQVNPIFLSTYKPSLISFIQKLKANIGTKLIIINTNAGKDVISPSDGFMFEGFAHGSWQEKDYDNPISEWQGQIARMRELVGLGKYILVSSGSLGKLDELDKQYHYALACYYLCAGPKTSFGYTLPQDPEAALHIPNLPEFDLGQPVNGPSVILNVIKSGAHNGNDCPISLRNFTNGLVIVNQQDYFVEIMIPMGYQIHNQPQKTSLVLLPRSGAFLKKLP